MNVLKGVFDISQPNALLAVKLNTKKNICTLAIVSRIADKKY